MPIAVSPKHLDTDFQAGWTLDTKIEVFIARVEGWHLGPAREMIGKKVGYRAFAILSIIVSYFEMIGKYRDGYLKDDKSAKYFKAGLKAVFPEMELSENEDVLRHLYENVRCALYHVGKTGSNILLTDDLIPGSIGLHSSRQFIQINVEILLDDLFIHFRQYANELQKPNNVELRRKFEARFDYDNP